MCVGVFINIISPLPRFLNVNELLGGLTNLLNESACAPARLFGILERRQQRVCSFPVLQILYRALDLATRERAERFL